MYRTKDAWLALPSLTCAFLSCWQVKRWKEKEEQIESASLALHQQPKHLQDALVEASRDGGKYVRVSFDAKISSPPIYVHPRTRDREIGSLVLQRVTCLSTGTKDGSMKRNHANGDVLWLRGWCPRDWNGDEKTKSFQTDAIVRVDGVIRDSEKPTRFAPKNDPTKDVWHWIDTCTMNVHLGAPYDAPLVEQIERNEDTKKKKTWEEEQEDRMQRDWPRPRTSSELVLFPVMPEGHIQYALTWAALSIATGAMALRAKRSYWKGS